MNSKDQYFKHILPSRVIATKLQQNLPTHDQIYPTHYTMTTRDRLVIYPMSGVLKNDFTDPRK